MKLLVPVDSGVGLMVGIVGPGECLGVVDLLEGDDRPYTASALTDVETLAVPQSLYLEAVQAYPDALKWLLTTITWRLRRTNELAADMAHLDIAGRIAKALLQLAEACGDSTGGAVVIDVPVTQKDLAAMVGGSRESVNKALGWYEGLGALERRGRYLAILRPELLQRRITQRTHPAPHRPSSALRRSHSRPETGGPLAG